MDNTFANREKFAVLATHIVDGGRQVLKKVLQKHVLSCPLPNGSNQTLGNFINFHQSTIFKLRQKNCISQDQLDLLMPGQNSADAGLVEIEKLDITLLSFLLTNICNLSKEERKNIDSLRKLRNSIVGHPLETGLSEIDYQICIKNIGQCLKGLAGTVGSDFEGEIKSMLDRLELRWGSIQVLNDWAARNSEITEKLESMETTLVSIQDSIAQTSCGPSQPCRAKKKCAVCCKECEERGNLFRGWYRCAECIAEEERALEIWRATYARLLYSSELVDDIQDDILKEYSPSHLKGNQEAVSARHNLLKAFTKDDKRRGQDDHTSWRYTLIRNYSSVQEPETKWGNRPLDDPRDKSLGANVERMRILQTKIRQMVLEGEMSEEVLNLYWSELAEVIKDVEAAMGTFNYSKRLTSVKTRVIDQPTASKMLKEFLHKERGGQRQGSQALMPTSCMVQMQQQLNRIESAICKKRKIDDAC